MAVQVVFYGISGFEASHGHCSKIYRCPLVVAGGASWMMQSNGLFLADIHLGGLCKSHTTSYLSPFMVLGYDVCEFMTTLQNSMCVCHKKA